MTFFNRCKIIKIPLCSSAFFWIIDLQEIKNNEVKEARSFLNSEAIQKSKKFIFEEDRHRSIITQGATRMIIGNLIEKKPYELTFSQNKFGKPYLPGHPVYFNLSHTKQWAFLGVSPSFPVGVDIEPLDRKVEFKMLDISSSEKLFLKNSGDLFDPILSLWCAKEAYLKAVGTGLAVSPPPLDWVSSQREGIDVFQKNDLNIYLYKQLLRDILIAVCFDVKSLKH